VLIPASLVRFKNSAVVTLTGDGDSLLILATAFAAGGLLLLMLSALHPYYLVYFTLWPVIGLSVLCEAAVWAETPRARALKAVFFTAIVAVTLAWMMSLAWNALRFRESIVYHDVLDQKPCSRKLSTMIPRGTKVIVSPDLFLLAELANLDYELLPFFDDEADVPHDAWLLLTEHDWIRSPSRIARKCIRARTLLLESDVYPPNPYFSTRIFLLGRVEIARSRSRGD
jgi:hypothetical protein